MLGKRCTRRFDNTGGKEQLSHTRCREILTARRISVTRFHNTEVKEAVMADVLAILKVKKELYQT